MLGLFVRKPNVSHGYTVSLKLYSFYAGGVKVILKLFDEFHQALPPFLLVSQVSLFEKKNLLGEAFC